MTNNKSESNSLGKQELLVIVTTDRTEEMFRQISARYKVQQVASPRVMIVEGDESELAELKQIPGVTDVSTGTVPPEIANKLDEGEALFVAAWISRNTGEQKKQRPGEGLSWDAPGFEPPDPAGGSGSEK